MNKKELLDRCARNGEERILLGRTLDKLDQAQSRGVPAHTPFLSPGEQAAVTDLLNAWGRPRHLFWGGYPDSERNICLFLPDWLEAEDARSDPEGPLAALQAAFPDNAALSHRDILGSVMGLGLGREVLGDILFPRPGACQAVVLRESLPIFLSQWESAGGGGGCRGDIPPGQRAPPPPPGYPHPETGAARPRVAGTAPGVSLSRGKAAALIAAGRVSLGHRECLKADRQVAEGDVIACRGLGKCVVKEISGQSKKGRTMLVIERYI